MISEVASGELLAEPGSRRGFLIGGRGDGSPRACTYNQGAPDQGTFDVRCAPDSGAKADIADGPSRAIARSRCAPARCTGARAEGPVGG
jgi:hypothetical protein